VLACSSFQVHRMGLPNMGNTCFLNVVIQMMRTVTSLTTSVAEHAARHNNSQCTTCNLSQGLSGQVKSLLRHFENDKGKCIQHCSVLVQKVIARTKIGARVLVAARNLYQRCCVVLKFQLSVLV
jgi:ubiquitin C-terminal hydrolase